MGQQPYGTVWTGDSPRGCKIVYQIAINHLIHFVEV
jgi:hypothetical protein